MLLRRRMHNKIIEDLEVKHLILKRLYRNEEIK
jgi:hypothetical protein